MQLYKSTFCKTPYLTFQGKAITAHIVPPPPYLNDTGCLCSSLHNIFIGKGFTRFPAVCLGPPTLLSVY